MIKIFIIVASVFVICSAVEAQSDSLFSRLRGISNGGTDFYNVDGIEITSQSLGGEFSKKNILKKFKRYSIKEYDLISSDSLIGLPNFYVTKTENVCEGTVQNTSYYFIENSNKEPVAITFASINKKDIEFEHQFIKLILSKSIPGNIYEPINIDSINFAGRKIALDNSCHWMGINNVQCPYYGQMNWSVHKSIEDASASVNGQFNLIKAKKEGKIISDESVDVIFEGNETKARKIVYDFKGITSLLVGMSGGKMLTVYFVAAPARQNFVSCVMSFWNNDSINPSGLPPLLEQVMKLKK